MKKLLAMLLCLVMVFSMAMMMTGCKSEEEKAAEELADAMEDAAEQMEDALADLQ